MECVIAIDVGTSSVKFAVVGETGRVYYETRKEFLGNDPSFYAREALNLVSLGLQECEHFIENKNNRTKKTPNILVPLALSISSNGPTVVAESGKTVLWNDENFEKIRKKYPPTSSFFIPKLLTLKEFFPDDYYSSKHIFSLGEFIIHHLIGESVTVLSEKRFKKFYWREPGDGENEGDLPESFGLSSEKLPPFVPMGQVLGCYKNLKVIAGPLDFVASLVGTGTLSAGSVLFRAGSSEGVNLTSNKEIYSPGVRTTPSVLAGLWNLSFVISESGSRLRHYETQTREREKVYHSLEIEVKKAFDTLKLLSRKHNFPFHTPAKITGGQAENETLLSEKARIVGVDIMKTQTSYSELVGTAAVAFLALGRFRTLETAARKLVKRGAIYQTYETVPPNIRLYHLPKSPKLLIFDIDSTLYTNEAYKKEQNDCQIRFYAKERGIDVDVARSRVSSYQEWYSKTHSGKRITLGKTLVHFGVSIETVISMRETLLFPEHYLARDEKLIKTLSVLSKHFMLAIITNNPMIPAMKTLKTLGVEKFFPVIFALDTFKKLKPSSTLFKLLSKKVSVKLSECLSVGDRFDMDLSPLLKLKGGGVLVSGVESVYRLPSILLPKA